MIVGRKREQEALERAFRDNESQFITIYGRRRIGKTYLIREFFTEKDCIFLQVTGLQNGTLKQQLENFHVAILKTFRSANVLRKPANWREAFEQLTYEIAQAEKKVVVFFDELPWLVTQRSGLMSMIDFYWNNQWSGMKKVIFIACGSSASWILKNIIYHTGGLHNRTTVEIKLEPFNLAETQHYLESKHVTLGKKHILSLYMAVGGIPYYLNYVLPGYSATQNIQKMFFDSHAPLAHEYHKLFTSLFDGAEAYKEIIEIIASKRMGVTLTEIANTAQLSARGGELTTKLKRLCDAGFIEEYVPWKKKRGAYYKVIDEFCLFYLYWIHTIPNKRFAPDHWLIESQRPSYYAWSGYAFEAVCSRHSHQIIRGLDIKSARAITSWRYIPTSKDKRGVQIDLVLIRGDDAITLCEIKYTDKPFAIDKAYAAILRYKIDMFREQTGAEAEIFLALVSANGIKPTTYSDELVSGVVTLNDLFKSFT